MTNQTFATYAQEIQPHVRSVLKKKEILKDWKDLGITLFIPNQVNLLADFPGRED